MTLKILHDGAAMQWGEQNEIFRLKDMIPHHQLLDTSILITAATENLPPTQLFLHLSERDQIKPWTRMEQHTRKVERIFTNPSLPELVIFNIGQMLTMEGPDVGLVTGYAIICRKGKIARLIPEADARRERQSNNPARVFLDAAGGIVTPGLVDPHTHPVFVGERSLEFDQKAQGRSYQDIHQAGGGILSTVHATRAADFEQLVHLCRQHLTSLMRWGVTTCEAKSGYALDLEGEIRLLAALRCAGDGHPMSVVPTLLGAHALPPEYASRRDEYVALVAEQMIPQAAAEKLALFCDAYCEEGAYTVEEVRTIFTAAQRAGLKLRLHAEQFSDQGGTMLALELGAASVDHLEAIQPAAIEALARSKTVAVLLPGAALSCRCPWPPARALLDAGVPVALGTDFNPGSSMTSSLPLMMSLACMQMGMSCDEVWRAVTRVAAASLNRQDIGYISPGLQADFAIFDVPDYRYIPYHFGDNHVVAVVKSGQVVFNRN